MLAFIGMPGHFELLIIGLIILLVFGNRLPSVMRSLGRGIVEFKEGLHGTPGEEEESDEESAKQSSESENPEKISSE